MAALCTIDHDDVSSIFHVDSSAGCRILTRNKANLTEKLDIFTRAGPTKLKVCADFDFTLTRFKNNGNACFSCHKVLEYSNYVTEQDRLIAKQLHSYYYPKEIDHTLTLEEKSMILLFHSFKFGILLLSCCILCTMCVIWDV